MWTQHRVLRLFEGVDKLRVLHVERPDLYHFSNLDQTIYLHIFPPDQVWTQHRVLRLLGGVYLLRTLPVCVPAQNSTCPTPRSVYQSAVSLPVITFYLLMRCRHSTESSSCLEAWRSSEHRVSKTQILPDCVPSSTCSVVTCNTHRMRPSRNMVPIPWMYTGTHEKASLKRVKAVTRLSGWGPGLTIKSCAFTEYSLLVHTQSSTCAMCEQDNSALCQMSYAVWLKETKCHVLNEQKVSMLHINNTKASYMLIWFLSRDEIQSIHGNLWALHKHQLNVINSSAKQPRTSTQNSKKNIICWSGASCTKDEMTGQDHQKATNLSVKNKRRRRRKIFTEKEKTCFFFHTSQKYTTTTTTTYY